MNVCFNEDIYISFKKSKTHKFLHVEAGACNFAEIFMNVLTNWNKFYMAFYLEISEEEGQRGLEVAF